MFTRNVAKLSLAVLSALVITAGPSMAKADDSAAERAFQLEWLKYQLQISDGGPAGPAPTRESVMRAMEAKGAKDGQGVASSPGTARLDTPADPIAPAKVTAGRR
jgi:hypothetical protein